MKLDEMVSETVKLLGSHGYRVELISYPEDHRRRGIDIAASRDNESLLLKVVEDSIELSPRDLRELRISSQMLGASSLVIVNKNRGVELDDIVAVEKSGVYMVSLEGLRAALRNEVYVVHRQGNLYMRVNGEKLREERIKRGYSLGDLASILGVTRRSVYLYEQGKVEVSLSTALKLLEVFGEEVFEPIPVLQGQERGQHRISTSDSSMGSTGNVMGRTVKEIIRAGGEAVETKRIPPDVIARVHSEKMLIVIEKSKHDRKFEKRIHESVKVAHHVRAKIVAIAASPEHRQAAEGYSDVEVYASVDEAVQNIRRLGETADEECEGYC